MPLDARPRLRSVGCTTALARAGRTIEGSRSVRDCGCPVPLAVRPRLPSAWLHDRRGTALGIRPPWQGERCTTAVVHRWAHSCDGKTLGRGPRSVHGWTEDVARRYAHGRGARSLGTRRRWRGAGHTTAVASGSVSDCGRPALGSRSRGLGRWVRGGAGRTAEVSAEGCEAAMGCVRFRAGLCGSLRVKIECTLRRSSAGAPSLHPVAPTVHCWDK